MVIWLEQIVHNCFNASEVRLQASEGRDRFINLVIHDQSLVQKCLSWLQSLDQRIVEAAGPHHFILNDFSLGERPNIYLLTANVFCGLYQKCLNNRVRILWHSL